MKKLFFTEEATIIKAARLAMDPAMSQSQLSTILGYKNGQYFSNVERELCGVPNRKVKLLCETLKINVHVLMEKKLNDTKAKMYYEVTGEEI